MHIYFALAVLRFWIAIDVSGDVSLCKRSISRHLGFADPHFVEWFSLTLICWPIFSNQPRFLIAGRHTLFVVFCGNGWLESTNSRQAEQPWMLVASNLPSTQKINAFFYILGQVARFFLWCLRACQSWLAPNPLTKPSYLHFGEPLELAQHKPGHFQVSWWVANLYSDSCK